VYNISSKSSLLGGCGSGVAVASTDDTVTYAAAVALVRHAALSQAAVTTQLLLQILPQHLDKRKFRRFVRLINVTAIHVHQPDICLSQAEKIHWHQRDSVKDMARLPSAVGWRVQKVGLASIIEQRDR